MRRSWGAQCAESFGGDLWAWNQVHTSFPRHLGCAYGFPVVGAGPTREHFDCRPPATLLRRTASGRFFVVAGIVVPSRVRREHRDRA
ncbi:hypothetical protein SRB17_39800 [Streptomyces sp. RB17]|uniref:hypothetical protein n=1 Tax=Streptomyces sp. RB17 TaxID=2585197 RepID=UPI001295C9A0|nr:hypothetical protein [Streptomyces sp. RB17]MQY35984.1 hypothetical protein [Streptomyces sp. RB17]